MIDINTMTSKVWILDRLEDLRVQLETLSPESAKFEQVETEMAELSSRLATLRLVPISFPE